MASQVHFLKGKTMPFFLQGFSASKSILRGDVGLSGALSEGQNYAFFLQGFSPLRQKTQTAHRRRNHETRRRAEARGTKTEEIRSKGDEKGEHNEGDGKGKPGEQKKGYGEQPRKTFGETQGDGDARKTRPMNTEQHAPQKGQVETEQHTRSNRKHNNTPYTKAK